MKESRSNHYSIEFSQEPKIEDVEKQVLLAIRAEENSHRLDQDALLVLNSLVGLHGAWEAKRCFEVTVHSDNTAAENLGCRPPHISRCNAQTGP